MALEEPLEEDIVQTINGVRVAIDKRIETEAENITMDTKDNQLVLVGINNCC
ncbi:MAG TPA: hypothetical protein VJ824_09985 [Bacillota bacterium]|nr:hypothetical protein [Bacillota bacterium]